MPEFRYQTNGALNPDSAAYIERSADRDLFENLQADEFCYVLAPRQMGKSSLLWRTVARLKNEGVFVAVANIQGMGDSRSEAEFYEGIVNQLVMSAEQNPGFRMPFDWDVWWEQQRGPLAQRMVSFIRVAFLESTQARWVLAIDEIDATINLSFTDSFFTAIRSCHDFRPGHPLFRRISFILLGVATPDSLIKDRTRTPFNVGRQVDLRGFTEDEAASLARGLPLGDELNGVALRRVMHWTGGQPHLTQDTCDALAKKWRTERAAATAEEVVRQVDDLIGERYLNRQTRGANPHFDYIEKQRVGQFPKKAQLLTAYRRTLTEPGLADNRESGVVAELKISGLARPDGKGYLRVANRVYATVFDARWAKANFPPRRATWVTRATLALLLVCPLFWYEVLYPRSFSSQLQKADALSGGDLNLARENYKTLRAIPFYQAHADRLWGELNRRRLEAAIDRDDAAVAAGSAEHQAEALRVASSARDELRELPESRWGQAAQALWADFHARRLRAAVRLDQAAYDEANSAAAEKTEQGGLKQRNAYQLTISSHATLREAQVGDDRPMADFLLAVFFRHRAERAEFTEQLGEAVLWRLRQLVADDQPAARQAVAHLMQDDLTHLTRSWGHPLGEGKDEIIGLRLCQAERRLVVATTTGLMRVWDVDTGNLTDTFRHGDGVRGIQLSKDERRLLSWSRDGTARIWEFGREASVAVFRNPEQPMAPEGTPPVHSKLRGSDGAVAAGRADQVADSRLAHPAEDPERDGSARGAPRGRLMIADGGKKPVVTPLSGAAFSPDEARVLTWGEDNIARLWDVATAAPHGRPMPHRRRINAAAFSPDGRLVATASDDGTARLWDAATGTPLQTLTHLSDVTSAVFSPNGQLVLTASHDATARLWDAATGALTATLKHPSLVRSAEFSPGGKSALTVGADGNARLWDVSSGAPRGELAAPGESIRTAIFSPNRTTVLTAGGGPRGGVARLWDATSGVLRGSPMIHHGSSPLGSALFSPDGKTVLTAGDDRTVRLWDAAGGAPLQTFWGDTGSAQDLVFNGDGHSILKQSPRGVTLYDVSRLRPLSHQVVGPDGAIRGARFGRDGKRALTWGDDGVARLWDVTTGEPRGQPMAHPGEIRHAAFSPDNVSVLTACADGKARRWDVATGSLLGRPIVHGAAINGVGFSPDGKSVLTAGDDDVVRLWDTTTGAPLGQPMAHLYVRTAIFSPDGKTIVTGGNEGTARLWDAATGAPLGMPIAPDVSIHVVAFSPDGKTILTAGDRMAHLWSASSRARLGMPMFHGSSIKSARFGPDGKTVLTASTDGTARLWDAATGSPREIFRHNSPVLGATFGPNNEDIFTRTTNWLHATRPSSAGERRGTNVFGTCWSHRLSGFILNDPIPDTDHGRLVAAVWRPDELSFKIEILPLHGYAEAPITGDPAPLLHTWQDKLGLTITPDGEVRPLRPIFEQTAP